MMNKMDTNTLVSSEELTQWWAELAQDEQSPDYYELTEYGELVLSPKPTNRHQRLCTEIAFQLRSQLGGEAVVEAAILTASAGVRVPDVVWMPKAQWDEATTKQDLLQAPDIVVEVLSPGNRQPEMNHKIQGYLQSGVQEVIVIGLSGGIEYIRQDGVNPTSKFKLNLTLPSQLFS
ncbi:MAG: Uma2 family endonuclease [Nitrospirales bacterium]